jgi:magnesium-transporting ATPase (P-type)
MERQPRPSDESIFAGGTGVHIVWVGILIAALTLGGFLYGFSSNGMEPFDRTLGLETFERTELVELIGEEPVPADWDEMSVDERSELLEEQVGSFGEEGSGGIVALAERIPRTIAFTVLAFTQMFEVMAIHAGDRVSFFKSGFANNRWLLWAVLSTFALQLIVVYVPFFQATFETAPLSGVDLLITAALGAAVLIGVEIEKFIRRQGMEESTASEPAPVT